MSMLPARETGPSGPATSSRGEPGGREDRPRLRRKRPRQPEVVSESLSADEERALAARIKAGDTTAQHRLILANMNLVLALVHDYKNYGLSLDDLIQEGNLGLIRASQDFDPGAFDKRFRTYASFWIRTSIHRALAASGSILRRTHYVGVLRLRYRRAIRELRGELDGLEGEGEGEGEVEVDGGGGEVDVEVDGDGGEAGQPGLERIAERMGVSLRKVETARRPRVDRGHSGVTDSEGNPASLDDLAADCHEPESELIDQEDEKILNAALFRLNPFEAWLIRERYGFRELPPEHYGWASTRRRKSRRRADRAAETGQAYYHRSYVEIGRDSGLSIHRVRMVEQIALDKLRKILAPRILIEHGLTADENG